MSFLSGLKVFGTDIVKAFAWFGSPKGQAIVKTGENMLEAFLPVTIPAVNLFNVWATNAYGVEALSVAAGKSTGTGGDKAALALSTITPQILQYAEQEGLSPRTAAQITAANNAVIAFINAMTGPAPIVATTSQTVGASTITTTKVG
jgi:hypothetical protein